MRKPIIYNSIAGYGPPVLLLQGFPANYVGTPGYIQTDQFKLASDRGDLKYIDAQFFDDGAAGASVNQDANFTVSIGGQNILESCGLANWDIESQLGKDKFWDVRIKAKQNQTITMSVDGRNNTVNQFYQLIAKYTTDQHENWLKKFPTLMNWKPGLKRKGYQLTQTIGTSLPSSFTQDLPRQNGEIIGIGIAQAGNVDYIDQLQTLITVSIDGVNIIENVCMAYFNTASGRDSYLNPIHIQPGSTMTVTMTPTGIGNLPISPALETTVLNIDLYFGRTNDLN